MRQAGGQSVPLIGLLTTRAVVAVIQNDRDRLTGPYRRIERLVATFIQAKMNRCQRILENGVVDSFRANTRLGKRQSTSPTGAHVAVRRPADDVTFDEELAERVGAVASVKQGLRPVGGSTPDRRRLHLPRNKLH